MKIRIGMVVWLLTGALLFGGCIDDSDIENDLVVPDEVGTLISAKQLNTWISDGYIDNNTGRRVVVLDTSFNPDFNSRPSYDSGHIPGAHYVDALAFYAMLEPRTNGVIYAAGLIPDGPFMDALIQRYGIDEYTTVVLTGDHVYGTARAYWAFRYWGFPLEQLHVLNGKTNTDQSIWTSEGYELETEEPLNPVASTHSVKDLPDNIDLYRATVSEFMAVASGENTDSVIIDARREDEWNGVRRIQETNIFAFRVRNSIHIRWTDLLIGGETGAHVYKSKEEIIDLFLERGVPDDKTVVSFCMAGGRGAVLFFACEAILNRPVKLYDGSSFELGYLAHMEDDNGNDIGLPEDSPWRFDLDRYCEIINYNDLGTIVPTITVDAYASNADQVNQTDRSYKYDF